MNNAIKICPICNSEFTPNIHNQIYCCKKCKNIAKNMKQCLKRPNNLTLDRACVICGNKYKPINGSQKVCSNKCKEVLKKQNSKKYNSKKPKKQYEPIKCKYCNEYFTPKKHNQIFCCKEHQENYYKETNYNSIKSKEHYKKNKEHYKKMHSEYYFANKEKTLERSRKNRAIRQANDPDFVLKKRVREQIRDHLKRNLKSKNFHTFELLGYTVQDLHNRLESLFEQNSLPNKERLNWGNMGTLWHIDHIKPCASFIFIDNNGNINKEAIKECWALENLQPMYSEDNMGKSSWYNGKFYQKGEAISEVDNA